MPRLSVLALLVGLAGCSSNDGAAELTGDAPVLRLLKDAPVVADFAITDLDGKTITARALRGKVVLVNFWATWCPPCRAEIADLVALQAKYKDQLVVLGISEDESSADTVRAFVAEHEVNYFIAMTTPELSKVFRGVAALPTTFVLDREGRIVQRHVGQINAEVAELETEYLSGLNTNVKVETVADPTKIDLKKAAVLEIPGLDLKGLTPARRTAIVKALNSDQCTCGCTLTIAECRINDPDCTVSLPLAKALAEKISTQ